MNVSQPVNMTADEFIAWALQQPSGRYELEKGEIVTLSAERSGHGKTKLQAAMVLDAAVRAAGLSCEVFPDGMAVQVDEHTVLEPDALVRAGPPLGDDDLKIPDPLVVVEVLSPSSGRRDSVTKLRAYFTLPSVQHYLILDPDSALVVHYARQSDGTLRTATLSEGMLRLDPPGLEVEVEAFFSRLNRERDANG